MKVLPSSISGVLSIASSQPASGPFSAEKVTPVWDSSILLVCLSLGFVMRLEKGDRSEHAFRPGLDNEGPFTNTSLRGRERMNSRRKAFGEEKVGTSSRRSRLCQGQKLGRWRWDSDAQPHSEPPRSRRATCFLSMAVAILVLGTLQQKTSCGHVPECSWTKMFATQKALFRSVLDRSHCLDPPRGRTWNLLITRSLEIS
ncbi:hypothetical protein VTI74DRAFT_4244 [Chaetomium olivicolor]